MIHVIVSLIFLLLKVWLTGQQPWLPLGASSSQLSAQAPPSSQCPVSPLRLRGPWAFWGLRPPFCKSVLSTHMKQYSEHRAFGGGRFWSLWGALTSALSSEAEFLPGIRPPRPLPEDWQVTITSCIS